MSVIIEHKMLYQAQQLQEKEYCFPYHYIAQKNGEGFISFLYDSWAINYLSTIEYLLGKIKVCPGTRIIDIGCGDGRFSRELSLYFPSSFVTGVDYSKNAIALAMAMNMDIHNLDFKVLNILEQNPSDVFDIAILMEVLEHIPLHDVDVFIKSTYSLLRPGGVLYLTVPHENKTLEYKHFQHFSVDKITKYLMPHFVVEEVVPFERINWVRHVIMAVLGNRIFVLRNPLMLSLVYKFYQKKLFSCASEYECQRLFVKAVAR